MEKLRFTRRHDMETPMETPRSFLFLFGRGQMSMRQMKMEKLRFMGQHNIFSEWHNMKTPKSFLLLYRQGRMSMRQMKMEKLRFTTRH